MWKRIALAMTLALSVNSAHALETYVYCSNANSLEWKWLPDNRHVQGRLVLRAVLAKNELRMRRMFSIDKVTYDSLVNECQNYFPNFPNPQPANHWYSDWYVFLVDNDVAAGHDNTDRALDLAKDADKIAYSNYMARYMTQYKRTSINNTRGFIHEDLPPYLNRENYQSAE